MALKVYGGELILSGTQVIAVTGALEAYDQVKAFRFQMVEPLLQAAIYIFTYQVVQ